MDSIDEKLFNDLSEKIEVPMRYEYIIKNALDNKEKNKLVIHRRILRTLITVCATIILTTGIAFASSVVYQKIFSFRTDVKDNTPTIEECKYAKEKMCEGLDKHITTAYYEVHDACRRDFRMEHMLLERVLLEETEELSNPNSEQWNFHEKENYVSAFNVMIKIIDGVNEKIINQDVKNDLNRFSNLLRKALETHDVQYCYEAHKIIHDYDFFCVNYDSATEEEVIEGISVHEYYGSISVIEGLRKNEV